MLAQVEPWTGRPLWIDHVPGARWAHCTTMVKIANRVVVSSAHRAPSLFPRLLVRGNDAFHEPRVAEHHGFGRPRRVDTRRALVLYVAWARDVAGDTQREVAENLYGGDTLHITQREIKRVRDAERDGRALYRDLGILPWAAFAEPVPVKRWWIDPAFQKAVRDWQLQAIAEPSEDPAPDPERARQEAWAQMQKTIGEKVDFAKIAEPFMRHFRGALSGLRVDLNPERLRMAALRAKGIEPWSFPEDDPPDA